MTPRSPEYLDFVRSLPCAGCDRTGPSDPHHVETGGIAIKGSDASTIPLCRSCHRELHQIGYRRWQQKHRVSVGQTIAKLLHLWAFGATLRFPRNVDSHEYVSV